jgi:hypothetical protein
VSAAAAVLVLVARLLIMGPEGTHMVSEHRARIPAGATGLLRETLHEEDLPGAVVLYLTPTLTPTPGAPEGGAAGEGGSVTLTLRSELWTDPAGAQSGTPPDELNIEAVGLSGSGTALVQLAESAATGRRLVLSLSTAAEEERGSAVRIDPKSPPEPVWFQVEAFRSSRGARELVGQRILKTLEGRPVSFELSWKRPHFAPDALYPTYLEEGLKLTIRPYHPPSGGWMTVEARLDASVVPTRFGGEPISLNAASHRTVTLGIPFEISLEVPPPEIPDEDAEAPKEAIIVQITPILPPGAGG